ncbi:harpin HrpZ family protein [Pseudomonas fluorescens]|uniref:DNA-binding protein n=1 Tax=Pseudomonas fluorescens TaxID=294 RepID=A0A944DLR0_PSEFL|nr:harpin HrpZ family protein [Pseudomonas fluorescens]MBT2298558.1 DNA-binding protein [Pseudomonas fluorescens]MBT2310083.1 DNA-binding protein [Pseudomonas fluorescens]MBT2311107.1 DNA-binding protein [Pseudomonas fluorescens]MBT2319958.1 DNA-binding protein [Pseudomonas fluorescens]MBT2329014.1 DNA-binding protein [Pseudomonas fluorescens]
MLSSSISLPQTGSFQGSSFSASNMADFQASSDSTAGQIASLLGDALFEKSGSGANIRNADNPLLGMIADYMDNNPDKFEKPDDANGKVRGWRDELSEDNYLSGDEKETFTRGLESLIKDLLGGDTQNLGSGNAGGTGGTGGMGSTGWNNASSPSGSGDAIQQLLSALLGSLGEEKLDNLLKPTGDPVRDARGEMEFSSEDNDVLKEVARFMDMHPEEFGKPDGKSKDWMGELSEGDQFMSRNESAQFQKAIDMIKGEVKDSAQGNSLGGLFPNAEQNFLNGGAGNTLQTDASIAAGNVLSVLTQQSATSYRG